jgi:hypothetical protein
MLGLDRCAMFCTWQQQPARCCSRNSCGHGPHGCHVAHVPRHHVSLPSLPFGSPVCAVLTGPSAHAMCARALGLSLFKKGACQLVRDDYPTIAHSLEHALPIPLSTPSARWHVETWTVYGLGSCWCFHRLSTTGGCHPHALPFLCNALLQATVAVHPRSVLHGIATWKRGNRPLSVVG